MFSPFMLCPHHSAYGMFLDTPRLSVHSCLNSWSSDMSYIVAVTKAFAGLPSGVVILIVHVSSCPGSSLSLNEVYSIPSFLSGIGFFILALCIYVFPLLTHAHVNVMPSLYSGLYTNSNVLIALLIVKEPFPISSFPENTE